MALRDYYRCKQCDAKIAYNPNRPEEEWEPFLLCRSCLADAETENTRLREALKQYRLRVHNLEQHNQWFERCESQWCHPSETQLFPESQRQGDRAALNPPEEPTDAKH